MRSFAAVLAVGLAALVTVSFTQRSSLVYSLGVKPALSAAQLGAGVRACQGPVRVPSGASFDRVGFILTPVGESRWRCAWRCARRTADGRSRPVG